MYCNHVWGSTYQTNLNNFVPLLNKLKRIITCSLFRAHTEALMMSLYNIIMYMTNMFVYQSLNGINP